MATQDQITSQTIDNFGEQWSHFTENRGYYASSELFEDLVSPLFTSKDFENKEVADIGSGSGRIVRMLALAGARSIVAVEPSRAMDVLKKNTQDIADRVRYVQARGDELAETDLDLVVSFGVIHHIPDPKPVIRTIFDALKPGGKVLLWVYGREGNELYLSIFQPLRRMTTRLPHGVLHTASWVLYLPLWFYIAACRYFPLPMRSYMQNHLGHLAMKERVLTIYDQLNPTWAHYYSEREARALLEGAGFIDIRLHHRHGYSWTVVGTKPV